MASAGSYSAWSTVDELVSKQIVESDGVASWQNFKKNQPNKHILSKGTAPNMPMKRSDKLGTGLKTFSEERKNEEKIRRDNGQAPMGAGFTHFKKKGGENDNATKLTECSLRVRPDNKTYFFPSETFTGYKEDYVFTTRQEKTGYYWDGMDSLRKKIHENLEDSGSTSAKAENTKRKKNKRKDCSANIIKESEVQTSNNPYEQLQNVIRRRDEVLARYHKQGRPIPQLNQAPLEAKNENAMMLSLLAAGWSKATDPATNKTYYYNIKTKETKWSWPLGTALSTASNTNQEVGSCLPKGWKSTKDEQGKKYYYNLSTGETSWNPPKKPKADVLSLT